MSLSINQHFTPVRLLKFAIPSIIMMLFMSLYTIIDGIFISRFIGSNALSSLNIVFPIFSISISIATMLATGGNAIISKYMGQGNYKKARQSLSLFVFITVIISLTVLILTRTFLVPISRFLGATDILLYDCVSYLGTYILFISACMLQTLFQSYLVTAGHPAIGLALTVCAGIFNAVLDYVFIVIFKMGIAGAALATGIGECIPAISGLLFFTFSKKELHFTRFKFMPKELLLACYNGSSEMVTQLSNAVITFLFNIILLRLAGETGIAAITILLYGQFAFNAFYMGFSIGIAPIIGFQYGASGKSELKNIYKISFIFVAISSVIITATAILLSPYIIGIFTNDPATYELAYTGFRIFAINFLLSGVNIVSSGFFTALSNGKISAVISFCRTLIFTIASLLILPEFIGINGVWLAIPVAELLTAFVCFYMHKKYFLKNGKKAYF